MSVAERLREERIRLEMTQRDFGDACGVTMQAQQNYEYGKRHPDTRYLEKAAALGVDVQYVITGVRSATAGEGVLADT